MDVTEVGARALVLPPEGGQQGPDGELGTGRTGSWGRTRRAEPDAGAWGRRGTGLRGHT